jgi:hypothetical protein
MKRPAPATAGKDKCSNWLSAHEISFALLIVIEWFSMNVNNVFLKDRVFLSNSTHLNLFILSGSKDFYHDERDPSIAKALPQGDIRNLRLK